MYLTIQLLELERPMVIALNFMDEATKSRRYHQCVSPYQKSLGIPVDTHYR